MDTDGNATCATYATPSLPKVLCPKQERLCGGIYERVYTGPNRQIFFYVFKNTFPASDLPDGEFSGLAGLEEIPTTLERVLPIMCEAPKFKLKFKLTTCPCIPGEAMSAMKTLAEIVQSKEIEELEEHLVKEVSVLEKNLGTAIPAFMETVSYMENVASMLDIPEGVSNDNFMMQLKETGVFNDMVIEGNKKGAGVKNISRFHLSKEDFYFYHVNNWTSEEVDAVNVTPVNDIDELDVLAGDSEIDVSKKLAKNERQLIANMTKSGAMRAHQSALNGKVCKKVNIVGFLADYKTECAKSIRRMEFDLLKGRTKLYNCKAGSVTAIPLETAFVSAAEYLRQKVQLSLPSP